MRRRSQGHGCCRGGGGLSGETGQIAPHSGGERGSTARFYDLKYSLVTTPAPSRLFVRREETLRFCCQETRNGSFLFRRTDYDKFLFIYLQTGMATFRTGLRLSFQIAKDSVCNIVQITHLE